MNKVIMETAVRVEAAELDLADDRYPDLMRALAYWRQKKSIGFAPSRTNIDPVDLVEFLPRLMLADVLQDPLDFRYRLAGTGISNVHGKEMTGKRPRDLEPVAYGELIHEHYSAAVLRREPILHLIMLDTLQRERSYARLLLPLSADGSSVTMLMAIDSKEQDTRALRDYFGKVTGRLLTCA